MKKFTITIEETSSQDFLVEANSAEEAMKIAREKWNNGEFCMDDSNLLDANAAVTADENAIFTNPIWENL